MSEVEFAQENRDGAPVLDVRTAQEFSTGHVEGAMNVDVHAHDFQEQIEELASNGVIAKAQPVFLYCRSGARSGQAARTLHQIGFTEAMNIGGYQKLKAAGVPVSV